MTTVRTKSIITITILLIVLAALSVASAVTARIGFGRGFAQGNFAAGAAPGGNFQGRNNGSGGNSQNGNDGGAPQNQNGNGGGNFQGGNRGGGFQGGNGGFQGRGGAGGFNLFTATRTLGINPQLLGYFNIGITVIGILLALLCAYGVWKQKRWALNLSIVVAILFLLAALPGFFFGGGRFNILSTATNIVNVGASAAIIVMSILPSVRDFVS